MGGPQVPDQAETFLRQHPFLDLVCHGEGERTFLQIIERREARSWREVTSISYLDREDRFIANPQRARFTTLTRFLADARRYLRGADVGQFLTNNGWRRGRPTAGVRSPAHSAIGVRRRPARSHDLGRNGSRRKSTGWLTTASTICVSAMRISGFCSVTSILPAKLPAPMPSVARLSAISVQNTKNRTELFAADPGNF